MEKKVYSIPGVESLSLELESMIAAPSSWSIDDGPKIPIGEDDGSDPTG
ncbi:MAG: hypothetical protein SPI35_06895 [Porphyromonas sp.]|nr:hypothetical protein [Porphyromonas sp.]